MLRKRLFDALRESSSSHLGNALWFLVTSVAAFLNTSRTHSLLTCATSAACLWLYCAFKCRKSSSKESKGSKKQAWTAGALLALAQLCRRAAGEVGRGGCWNLALAPWAVLLVRSFDSTNGDERVNSRIKAHALPEPGSVIFLLLATASSCYVLGHNYLTPTDTALGICESLCIGTAYMMLERLFKHEIPRSVPEKLILFGPEGEILAKSTATRSCNILIALREVAAATSVVCGVLAWALEGSVGEIDVAVISNLRTILWPLVGSAAMLLGFELIANQGSFNTSLWSLAALVISLFWKQPSWLTLISTAVCLQALSVSVQEPTVGSSSTSPQSRRRWKWLTFATTVVLLVYQSMLSLTRWNETLPVQLWPALPGLEHMGTTMQVPNAIHPIKQLVSFAERQVEVLQARQSTTLARAVAEYKRRYGIPPPPHFDQWYKFARKNDVQIYDDYDTIHHAMQPFWALKPANIRSRVQEAVGYGDNALIVLMIRNGRISKLEGGLPWQREAITGLVVSYVEMLPDLDVAFNAHDEPRIVVPYDELSRMITIAKQGSMSDAFLNNSVSNMFSPRPPDMTDGLRIEDYKASRFNEYAHQNTWVPSRLSCAPDSPARSINEDAPDDTATFALGPLGFIHNQTASTDICNIPSLHGTHAFFDRPNAFSVAHDLIPIFSESKVSSFQDIPYPSLWHWYGALFTNSTADMHTHHTPMYNESDDPQWSEKTDTLYWRGSTTGGYSRNGGWRRHHRQRLVSLLNSHDQATILTNTGNASSPSWHPTTTPRATHVSLFDVAFSGVGQCDPADCHAQEEYFQLEPHTPLNATWNHKHVLDIDGNAFSARFYALLRSRSLVYKAAIFREWHDEWLVPWLHYIPLSLGGGETLEALRFFAEGQGAGVAEKLADVGREWAGRVLRRADMEAWMFRCLLEYARVVDDNRSGIGYIG